MRTTRLAGLASIMLLIGCGGADPLGDNASVSEALDSSDDTSNESAFMLVSTDGTQSAGSANEAATMAAANSKTWWQPSTCVTSTAQLNVVTYTLDNCTGPWGLVHVSGTAVVTYTPAADGIHAVGTASSLKVNGATMDLNATATYSVTNGTKKLVVATSGSGVGQRGNTLTRSGSYTLTWNDATQCGTLDGAWSTGINNATWSTSISGYAQCKGKCPTSGTLAHTGGLSKVTVTVAFDGSGAAKWTTSRGHSGTIALFCIN